VAVCGCAAPMEKAEQQATAYCAAHGAQPIVLDAQESGSASWVRTATLFVRCVEPRDLVPTNARFGADLVSDPRVKGAIVVAVIRGSISDKAGLKTSDAVYEYGGRAIATASDLQAAVSNTTAGDRILIRIRRSKSDVDVQAQF
jgi:S1-C subfamily serine protease